MLSYLIKFKTFENRARASQGRNRGAFGHVDDISLPKGSGIVLTATRLPKPRTRLRSGEVGQRHA